MKRLFLLIVLIAVVLVGYTPVAATPTKTPEPTSPHKIYKVTHGTGLYDVCGDTDAKTLDELSEGTDLSAFGKANALDCCKFVDSGMNFELCHMEVVSSGKTGWVLKQWFK